MKRKLATNLTHGLAAAAVLALGASGAVYAAGMASGTMDFNTLDKDGNGLISQQEATQDMALSDKFKEADKDGNGQLDNAEFSAFETMESGTMDKKMTQ